MKLLRYALGAGLLGYRVLRRQTTYSFHQRVVVITGGSRGLGLVLSRQLVAEGARLCILARDEDELQRAATELRAQGGEVQALVCDVRDRQQVEEAIDRCSTRYGSVDVLINCAGIIQAAPLEHLSLEDFQHALDTHLWGPLYTTQAVFPLMREQGQGRIVNIASIGGKIAVPHMIPYTTSKFALVGLSDGLRAELAKYNIKVTTVCPGLMRTGAHYNSLFKGQHRDEFTWFSILDALPITSVSATQAAQEIIAACRRGDPELVISIQAKIIARLSPLFPGVTAKVMQWMDTLLPDSTGPEGDQLRTGWESQSLLAPSLLTRLADRATIRNNELNGHPPPIPIKEL